MPKGKSTNMIPVAEGEQVARAIFSPSFLDLDGQIGPQAFYMEIMRSGKAEANISLFRLEQCDDIIAAIKRLPPRKKGDSICGHGELNVGEIRQIQIPLEDSKVDVLTSEHNPVHAGIVIQMEGELVTACNFYKPNGEPLEAIDPNLMYIMYQLAEMSSFVRLPAETEE